MGRLLTLLPAMLIALAAPASAQFSIAPALNKGPIAFDGGLHIEFTQFGQLAAASATARAKLQGAKRILDAMIPQFNQQLTCGHGWKYAATINDIIVSDLGGSLKLTAQVHIVSCGFFGAAAVEGNISLSSTIQPIIVHNTSVQLQVTDPIVQSEGVHAVGGFIEVSDKRVSESTQEVSPKIKKFVSGINQWLVKEVFGPAQKQIRAYKLQIQSAQLDFQEGDLIATIAFSGQSPISVIDKELGF